MIYLVVTSYDHWLQDLPLVQGFAPAPRTTWHFLHKSSFPYSVAYCYYSIFFFFPCCHFSAISNVSQCFSLPNNGMFVMFALPDLFVITLLQPISQYAVWLPVIHPVSQTSPIKLDCNECDSISTGLTVYHNWGIVWEFDFKYKVWAGSHRTICCLLTCQRCAHFSH